MPSRQISDLSPTLQPLARRFLAECLADPWLRGAGITILVTCTYRSNEEQAALFAQGRTKPGKIVTWARPGQSKHNRTDGNGKPGAWAFDIVPLRGGKPVWGTRGNGIDDDPEDDDTDDLEVWQRVGEIGERVGLAWAGRWPPAKREFPHFELRD